jgi:MFS family permease
MNDDDSIKQVTTDPFAALKVMQYRNLITGRFMFVMSLRMITSVVGWWIYELTNDPLAIGLVGLSEFIPAFIMALYAGHVIDRSEKRNLMLRSIFVYLCVAGTLLFLSSGYIGTHLKNNQIALCIYGLFVITGLIRSFVGPSFSTMIAGIVPRHLLQNAITWNQGAFLTASVTGHATGGFLIHFIGIHNTLIVVCSIMTASLLVLAFLKRQPPLAKPAQQTTLQSMGEGLRFVFKTKEILGALSLDLFAVLFGGAVALVPIYARDILQVGSIGFGWLNAATDIGAIISVLTLTFMPMRRNQGKKLMYAVAGFGVCIIIFGLSKWFILSFLALVIAGIMDGVSVVTRGTIMQLKTPDHVRGRVMSVSSMFINSSNELGQFESGTMARLLGVIPSVVFGGCMTIGVVIITWFKAPSLRKMQY